ncbi:acyl-CoA dehydrogenase family protein [Sinomonas susongensis]|uniref:acyl-CoA dehydrogenase family protein n=1 Tax=Sinomonas susongensis TaxID=1324851 RepID=UPI001BB0EF4C|nr:acyl-CoA dehydrogenase family protein [Sinomonas susongensis]
MNEDYEKLRSRIAERMWEVFPPMEEEIEHTDVIPKDVMVPALQEVGALGLLVPKEYGGAGLTVTQYLPILADLSRIHGGLRGFVHAHNSSTHVFSMLASEEQKARLLPLAARGEVSFGMGITEPDHGTGADIGTTATRDGEHYVLTGQKWLTTNSDWVRYFIVFCKTDPAAGAAGVSAILMERDAEGLRIDPLPPTLGTRGLQHGHVQMERVRVPIGNRLGREGEGLGLIEEGMELSRVFVAASSLGTAEEALQMSLARARSRETFGQPIGTRQAVQRYLAEMATDVLALRSMLENTAARIDAGHRVPAEASACKLFGLEAVCRVTDRALLVFGGIGFTRKFPIERMLRDARANVVEEGPPAIQHLVIARTMLMGYYFEGSIFDTPYTRAVTATV